MRKYQLRTTCSSTSMYQIYQPCQLEKNTGGASRSMSRNMELQTGQERCLAIAATFAALCCGSAAWVAMVQWWMRRSCWHGDGDWMVVGWWFGDGGSVMMVWRWWFGDDGLTVVGWWWFDNLMRVNEGFVMAIQCGLVRVLWWRFNDGGRVAVYGRKLLHPWTMMFNDDGLGFDDASWLRTFCNDGEVWMQQYHRSFIQCSCPILLAILWWWLVLMLVLSRLITRGQKG